MSDEMEHAALDVSVVVPVFNEEQSLTPLCEKLLHVLPGITARFEIIFVDDGSTDGSPVVLEDLHRQDSRVRVIQFRRNLGKSAALSVGFSASRGNVIVTMDADLQDDPEEIPKFLEALDQGYDLVSGWKFPRLDPLSKTLPSAVFNWTTGKITGLPLHDLNCGFKAYRREVVEELHIHGELYRYIPLLAHWRGFKITEIKVHHHPRQYGKSKYGLERFSRGFLDLWTVLFLNRYNRRPLHLFGWIGFVTVLVGLVILIYLSILWLEGVRPIGTRPLLSFGVLFLFMGIQFISFGLLAELVTQTLSSAREDDYPIKRTLG
jgi:glycosyltransferase involved in cell wall biosynthesis